MVQGLSLLDSLYYQWSGEMNEDKVRTAINIINAWGSAYPLSLPTISEVAEMLEEAIAPPEPEIPEGCPVLVWNEDGKKGPTFYCSSLRDAWDFVEIDYQRKGHVIPWHGGDMKPIVGEGALGECDVFLRSGWHGVITSATSFSWEWAKDAGRGSDIIAYVIWPEWAT